jgi:Cd2+/Zn2+-exporting ATPase
MSNAPPSCACESEEKTTSSASFFKLKDFKLQLYSLLLMISAYAVISYSPFPHPNRIALPLLILSYLLVGWEVIKKAFSLLKRGDFFNEFSLMTLATLGAFYIGDYLEGVFVMLFYSTGEIIQGNAVRSVRHSIRSLLELNVRSVSLLVDGNIEKRNPEEIKKGDLLRVNPGEMLALDGIVIDEDVFVNTANITGESLQRIYHEGDSLLAGMVCNERPFNYKVSAVYDQSYISKIMHLVEDASSKKAKTQRLISRLSKSYTPIVFFLALALITLPYFFDPEYAFNKWLYRGMVFLVISCPCAFLIAIPLSYFGGIGLAASKGILFKGGEIIEKIARIKSIVFDKTGTLTYGKYSIFEVEIISEKEKNLARLFEVESNSTHPLAKTVVAKFSSYAGSEKATSIREYPGMGIEALFEDRLFLAGNKKWLISKGIQCGDERDLLPSVHIAYAQTYLGKITFNDELKENAKAVVDDLRTLKMEHLAMLSGDSREIVQAISNELGLDEAYGELLPEDKMTKFAELRGDFSESIFVGDGVNDAPVIAMADVGVAMGTHGSDAAIESADVVIEYDDLEEIPRAIKIARKTQSNVYQNLFFAAFVKITVLLLAAYGIAGLWEAIFADVGVALLVVLNAYRLKMMKV